MKRKYRLIVNYYEKYNFVTNRESMISRLPSLFPYLEWDENGICKLHPSTDSINGSYGKLYPI